MSYRPPLAISVVDTDRWQVCSFIPSAAPDPGQDSKLRIVDLSNASTLRRGRITVDLAFIEEQFADIRRDSSRGSGREGRAVTLKAHRRSILKAHAPNRDFKSLARHLGVSPSALYGMARGDRSRYSEDTLKEVLDTIGCSRRQTPTPPHQ